MSKIKPAASPLPPSPQPYGLGTALEPVSISPAMAAKLSGVSLRSIYRLLEAKAFKARRSVSGARTLIDYISWRHYFKSLPEYTSGVSMVNAPHMIGRRKRKARRVT